MLICTFCNNRQISAVLDRHRQQEAIETEQASIKKLEEAKEERKKEIQKSRERAIQIGKSHPSLARQMLAKADQLEFTPEDIQLLISVALSL